MSSKPIHTPCDELLRDVHRYARLRGDPRGGRTDEFRSGERLRGDRGGGPSADGLPSVPHAPRDGSTPDGDRETDAHAQREDLVTGAEYDIEAAILEVEVRFDEPALEALESIAELWAEAVREAESRPRRRT